MINKEEIEEMKKYLSECITKDTVYEEDLTISFMKKAKEYIEQLESELEMYKDIKDMMNSKVKVIKILTNKDIDKKVNERNKKLIEKLEKDSNIHDKNWKGLEIEKYAKEILKILKGENDESNDKSTNARKD